MGYITCITQAPQINLTDTLGLSNRFELERKRTNLCDVEIQNYFDCGFQISKMGVNIMPRSSDYSVLRELKCKEWLSCLLRHNKYKDDRLHFSSPDHTRVVGS